MNNMRRQKSPNVDLYGKNQDGKRRCDAIVEELAKEAPKTKYGPKKYLPWISERSLRLCREKASAMKKGQEHLVAFISKELRKNLRRDRKERIREVAEEIEQIMKGKM